MQEADRGDHEPRNENSHHTKMAQPGATDKSEAAGRNFPFKGCQAGIGRMKNRPRGGPAYDPKMMRAFPLALGLLLWVGAAEKPPVLLRVHLQAPEGAQGMVTVPVTLLNPPETIAIRNLPEVSEKDVRQVRTLADGTLLVAFDDFGKTKLEVATNTGRGLILVVIVNGRVVYAPSIDTTLTQGTLALPAGSILPDEVQTLNDARNRDRAQKLEEIGRP